MKRTAKSASNSNSRTYNEINSSVFTMESDRPLEFRERVFAESERERERDESRAMGVAATCFQKIGKHGGLVLVLAVRTRIQ